MQEVTEKPILIETVLQASLGVPGVGKLRPLLLKLRRRCTEPLHQQLAETLLDSEMREIGEAPGEVVSFPSGWSGILQAMLKQTGVEYQYVNKVTMPPGGLNPQDFPYELQGFVNGLSVAPRGQAVLVGRSHICPSLGALFRFLGERSERPVRNMLVCCRSNKLKQKLANELKAILPESVRVMTDHRELEQAGDIAKLFLANADEFESAASNPDAWDVYVVIEARVGLWKIVQTALEQRPNIPRYCLRFVDEGMYPVQELALATTFGKILYEPQHHLTKLTIAFRPAGQSHNALQTVQVRDGQEAAAYKRKHVWLNPERNQYIASIVKAIETKNEELLTQLCTSFDKSTINSLLQGRGMSIAVENQEQGKALLELLPGWTLKTRVEAPAPEAMAEQDTGIVASEPETEEEVEIPTAAQDRCLVTESWLAKGRIDTQNVIRVGGWPGNLDNRNRSTSRGHLTRLLLELEEPRILRTADNAIRPKVVRQPRHSVGNAESRKRN